MTVPPIKQLILGPIPDQYHPELDVVVSFHSFVNLEKIYPTWHTLPILTVRYDQRALLAFTDQFLEDIVMPNIAAHLNQLHGVTRSALFWRVLVMPYVLELWGMMISALLLLIPVIDAHPEEKIHGELLTIDGNWDFVDIIDFNLRGLKNPTFVYWLLSQLCIQFAPKQWHLSEHPTAVDRPTFTESAPHSDTRRFQGVEGFSEPQRDLFSWMLRLKSFIKPTAHPISGRRQSPYLNDAPIFDSEKWELALRTVLPTFFNDILFRNLPLTVTRNFKVFDQKARQLKYRKNALRVIRTSYYHHEEVKYYMAHALNAGEVILGSQHGGTYGITQYHFTSSMLEIRDRWFVSWGWQNQEGISENIIPMASPELSKIHNRHLKKSEDIVWIATHMCAIRLGSLYSEYLGWDWVHHINDKFRFLRTLDPTLHQRLLYRPHPDTQGCINEIPSLHREYPSLKISSGGIQETVLGAALLIFDNTSTTLNFVIAANTPFILIIPNENRFSRESIPVFDQLVAAGIAFFSPELAAQAINTMPNIAEWWASSTVQKARCAWMNAYARTSPTPFWDWARMLWNT